MIKYVVFTIIVQLICINQVYADGLEPGTYYCLTENLVGIQPIKLPSNINDTSNPQWVNKKNRSAGALKPEKDKFVVKVERVDLKEKLAKGCFADSKPGLFSNPPANSCNADLKITLPKEKVKNYESSFGKLYSNNLGNMFTNTFNIFWVFGEGRLHYTSVSLAGIYGNYLEEGSCEAF